MVGGWVGLVEEGKKSELHAIIYNFLSFSLFSSRHREMKNIPLFLFRIGVRA